MDVSMKSNIISFAQEAKSKFKEQKDMTEFVADK
jgi:hypothetical protein